MRPFVEADARAGEAVRPPLQAMRPVLEAKRPFFTAARGVARASLPLKAARRAARLASEAGRKGFTVERDTSGTAHRPGEGLGGPPRSLASRSWARTVAPGFSGREDGLSVTRASG